MKSRIPAIMKAISSVAVVLCSVIVIVCIGRLFVCDRFVIRGDSMEPTLHNGQCVYVNKLILGPRLLVKFDRNKKIVRYFRLLGQRRLKVGDLAIYNYPYGQEPDKIGIKHNYVYAKRCAACPGDTLSIISSHYHNYRTGSIGTPASSENLLRSFDDSLLLKMNCLQAGYFAGMQNEWTIKDLGPIIIPAKGMSVSLNKQTLALYCKVIEYETGKPSASYLGQNYTFNNNYYFFVGDNLVESVDSRYDGFVPEDFVVGVIAGNYFTNETNSDTSTHVLDSFGAVLDRYSNSPEDSLKYKSALFLLDALPYQWHFDNAVFDSLGIKRKVMDIEVIDSDYLIENIDYAFKAWELPWCRNLSFEDFCHFILPYKIADEEPVRWRKQLWEEFSWVRENTDDFTTVSQVCSMINNSINQWFTINWDNPYPLDLNYFKARELKEADCYGASMMILYPMRAMGVPAVFEGVPRWVNRSGAHFWNALYDNGSLRTFSGPERNPGAHKIQFVGVGRMMFKMPKVWRRDYSRERLIDVTREYIPVCDVTISRVPKKYSTISLMTFDNRNWQDVDTTSVIKGKAVFKDMARDVVYLPAGISYEKKKFAIQYPLLIDKSGGLRILRPSPFRKESVCLTAKYPEDDSNLIFCGERYELFYWKGNWKSLGRQVATSSYLVYNDVPKGALLLLRNIDKGVQERIFIYEGGRQIWY